MSRQFIQVKLYSIIQRAVEEGIEMGYNRAYKYTDTPTRDIMVENLEREIMNSLSEVIDFEDVAG